MEAGRRGGREGRRNLEGPASTPGAGGVPAPHPLAPASAPGYNQTIRGPGPAGRFPRLYRTLVAPMPARSLSPLLLLAALAAAAAPAAHAQTNRLAEVGAPPLIGFGTALALDGHRLLVGRPATVSGFPMPPSEGGAVHLFAPGSGGAWTEVGVLRPGVGEVGDGFGSALSVDGDWMAVGAPQAEGATGGVHLFRRAGEGWEEVVRLHPSELLAGSRFGAAVLLRENLLVAAAPGGNGGGEVRIFRRDGESWTEEARLSGEGGTAADHFGTSLLLTGEFLLVGAPGPTVPGGPGFQPRPGRVFHFGREETGWALQRTLEAGDANSRGFGAAMAYQGEELFVGSSLSEGGRGEVRAFRRQGEGWQSAGVVQGRSPGSLFGHSLERAGSDLVVGAPMAGGGTGAVTVFRRSGSEWREVQTLAANAQGLGVQFGSAVLAAGDRLVVGGPGAAFFEGLGFVYSRDGAGNWQQESEVFHEVQGLTALTGDEVRCEDGSAALFPCSQVDILSFIPLRELGADRGIMLNDMWGWTHGESGREFALVGRLDGTVFIEVTDPSNPIVLGELPLHSAAQPNMWRDIKVYADHAFIVADGAGPHGMQVFDLTQLLTTSGPFRTFEETAHYDRIASAHNIVINEDSGFAYAVGSAMGGETCGGALHMIDIRDPVNPTFAGCFGDPATGFAGTGYTHDAQCVTYSGPHGEYRGREICFNSSENALGIADVTDKANPVALGNASYPNVAYAHQGWLTEDQAYFFVNDEGDEVAGTVPRTRTLIFDVRDLTDPIMVKEFLGTTAASDHNLYIKGDYMYQSHYVAGLRIVDISDPLNPVEVGYLDTVPQGEDVPGFAGSWSNYPFFQSGAIGVTSMREGFFMVRFRPTRLIP